MTKKELNDKELEKLSQKYSKKLYSLTKNKIEIVRDIVYEAYNLGFGDAVELLIKRI